MIRTVGQRRHLAERVQREERLALVLARVHVELDELVRQLEHREQLTLPDTKITTAESMSGTFAAPGVRDPLKVPSICRVAGVVSPAIKFEVWLPEGSAWNGKFEAVGGGGLAGIISYPALAEAVNAGYASASTDTGHEATDTHGSTIASA